MGEKRWVATLKVFFALTTKRSAGRVVLTMQDNLTEDAMKSNALTEKAAEAIKRYRNNPIIMAFVKKEAIDKVAAEIRVRNGNATLPTSKGTEILSYRYANIAERIEDYITIGLIGCYMASLEI